MIIGGRAAPEFKIYLPRTVSVASSHRVVASHACLSGQNRLVELHGAQENSLEHSVVDFPVDDGVITPSKPKQASKRLAVWLWLGIFAFVGIIIIPMFIAGGRLRVPELTCNEVMVGNTAPLLSGGPIYEARYQIVVKNISIPLPRTLMKIFMKGSRCGQP